MHSFVYTFHVADWLKSAPQPGLLISGQAGESYTPFTRTAVARNIRLSNPNAKTNQYLQTIVIKHFMIAPLTQAEANAACYSGTTTLTCATFGTF
jgi:hypothetical protein